jgi:hypothetical protein
VINADDESYTRATARAPGRLYWLSAACLRGPLLLATLCPWLHGVAPGPPQLLGAWQINGPFLRLSFTCRLSPSSLALFFCFPS